MPALSNPRHEAFCQAYVKGKTAGNATASYIAAGFRTKGRSAGVGASNLLKQANIVSRVAAIQAQAVEIEDKAVAKAIDKLAITKERILSELAKIGFSNMLDYVRTTDEGDIYVDMSRLERDTAAAIQEVTVDTYSDGRGQDAREVKRVRFKLSDKRAALVDMGKHIGLFAGLPPPAPTVNVNVSTEVIDRPPRETYAQWEARRARELGPKTSKPEKK